MSAAMEVFPWNRVAKYLFAGEQLSHRRRIQLKEMETREPTEREVAEFTAGLGEIIKDMEALLKECQDFLGKARQ